MPCVHPGCGAPAGPETVNWNVGDLCTLHYNAVAATFNLPKAVALVDDFVKVYVLLQFNTALCLAKMGLFEAEMGRAGAAPPGHGVADPRFTTTKGHGNYLKLSRALEYYEGYCWFPANRALLGGLLSADAFNRSLKLGFNKDPGAGRMHGEQSHRVQWHVIMRCMTNDFATPFATGAGWKHSPLQLFYHFTQGDGATVGAWGKAMDAQINRGWGNPDNVVKDLLGSGLTLVKHALQRRIDKYGGPDATQVGMPMTLSARDQALQTAMLALLGQRRITLVGGPNEFFEKVVAQIYAWEKQGFPTFPSGDLAKGAKAIHEAAKAASPALFQTDKTYRKVETNLLAKKGAPDKLVEIDASLIAKSRAGFNGDYAFSVLGVDPTPSGRW